MRAHIVKLLGILIVLGLLIRLGLWGFTLLLAAPLAIRSIVTVDELPPVLRAHIKALETL